MASGKVAGVLEAGRAEVEMEVMAEVSLSGADTKNAGTATQALRRFKHLRGAR